MMSVLTPYDDYLQRGYVPVETDPDSEPWWAEVRAGRFTLPRCGACGHRWFPLISRCPRCASAEVTLDPASTGGRISSWVTVHRALDEAFLEDTPYTIVAVEMGDGGRMFGRLLTGDSPVDGLAVEARTYRVGDEILLGFAAL